VPKYLTRQCAKSHNMLRRTRNMRCPVLANFAGQARQALSPAGDTGMLKSIGACGTTQETHP
jgi:hypothetical protein